MQNISEVINDMTEHQKNFEFLPTGFQYLDTTLLGGFLKKELVVIGGSTGSGKSFFVGEIMFNLAKLGFKTCYFSLEISNAMIISRLLGGMSNIQPTEIQVGRYSDEDKPDLKRARAELKLYDAFIHLEDNVYQLSDIVKIVKANSYDFVIVDFIQNVQCKGENENTRLTLATITLQKLAKETNSCIVVVSQLSNLKAQENGSGAIEYRGSGSIAIASDLAFLITPQEDGSIKLLMKKNRRGSSGYDYTFLRKVPGGKFNEA